MNLQQSQLGTLIFPPPTEQPILACMKIIAPCGNTFIIFIASLNKLTQLYTIFERYKAQEHHPEYVFFSKKLDRKIK